MEASQQPEAKKKRHRHRKNKVKKQQEESSTSPAPAPLSTDIIIDPAQQQEQPSASSHKQEEEEEVKQKQKSKRKRNKKKATSNVVGVKVARKAKAISVNQLEGAPSTIEQEKRPHYRPHFSKEAVEIGLKEGPLIKGILRINPKDSEHCWIDRPQGQDYLIRGARDRNRALHGDTVALKLKHPEKWVVRDHLYQEWRAVDPIEEEGEEVLLAVEEQLEVLTLNLNGVSGHVYSRDEMLSLRYKVQQQPEEGVTIEVLLPNGNSTTQPLPPPPPPKPRKSTKDPRFHTFGYLPDKQKLPDDLLQRTAEVVHIIERKRPFPKVVGHLRPTSDAQRRRWALFTPTDARAPRMFIPVNQCPDGLFDRPQQFAPNLYAAQMEENEEWKASDEFPLGRLLEKIGRAGEIESETAALLMTHNIDTSTYPAPLESKTISIDEGELAYRRDFRSDCVFTIDPATARDLDDALHVKRVSAGKWEVGVHIADVAHFIEHGSELDEWAASRATSVYMVDGVVPMLPRHLCEDLCSLNPNTDRLTFSVCWIMDDEANIVEAEEWFGRSVIRSRAKLSYGQAQAMIDHVDVNGDGDITASVLQLNCLAKNLREKRMANGALRLNQPKLRFELDPLKNHRPMSLSLDSRSDANYLVEEFMLLANQAVAKRIHSHYPDIALLRRHPPPKEKALLMAIEKCARLAYPVEGGSSRHIAKSLDVYERDAELRSTVLPLIVQWLMRSMQLAVYFCTGETDTIIDTYHYALSVEHYTHFTSPIRRFPDIIVHRLLAASLEYHSKPNYSPEQVQALAQRCNEAKQAAKAVGDAHVDIYFGAFIREVGGVQALGIVTTIYENAFDVLLPRYGINKRVNISRLDFVKSVERHIKEKDSLGKITLLIKGGVNKRQTIQVLSVVKVVLKSLNDSVKYYATIEALPDEESLTFADVAAEVEGR